MTVLQGVGKKEWPQEDRCVGFGGRWIVLGGKPREEVGG